MSKFVIKEAPFDYAIPPGKTLLETIESFEMSQKEFALRSGLTVQTLNRIFKGTQPITYETAERIEMVTGTPARFWNNLEALYREQLAKAERVSKLKIHLGWLKTIPTEELIDRNCIEPTEDHLELLKNTLAFFAVSSVGAWQEVWQKPAVVARRSLCFDSEPGPASVWIRMGELKAQQIECEPYDKNTFKNALTEIRGLTRQHPKVFEPELKRLCAESGVALALVRELKKVPWSGATKWLSPKKAMILLSLRGRGEDRFWFSFFHEAGHVLYDNKKDLYINDESDSDPREEKANQFAADFLIPPQYNKEITRFKTKAQIIRLADGLDIAPGIVAGRYQHLTDQWNYFNDLIKKLKWKEDC